MAVQPGFEDLKMGCVLVVLNGEPSSPLPLERTTVSGQITGAAASVRVTQQFGNPFTTPIELQYLFPLPHTAAIVDYTITIGGRRVQAELKEAESARRVYQEAVNEGKRASLLEQRRPNLFSIQIGNVQPDEKIICELQYEERLSYQDGLYEFIFPMGITPRYHSPLASLETAQSADSALALPGERIAPVELQLAIDAGVDMADPQSPSHPIQIQRQDSRRVSLGLAGDRIPNKDFVLRYVVSGEQVRAAVWSSADGESETVLVTLIPPRLQLDAQPGKREFVFVLDRSGSMSEGPMTQARNALRACLRALNDGDTFYIQAFDNEIEWFSRAASAVTQTGIDAADAWLENIRARGGTEILRAIDLALALPPDPERQRYIIFLTDGAVSADEQAIGKISKQRADARIFTFGIGPSVNRFLLAKMAQMGRGSAEFLGVKDDIESAISRFQDRVSYPALQDIQLEWKGAQAWDLYPEVLPDLYVGQPLEIVIRIKRTGEVGLRFSGKLANTQLQIETPIAPPTAENPTLKRIWARARVESLLDRQYQRGDQDSLRQQVISIALEHRLLTPFTSFVAVDSEITRGGEAKRINVSVPLPEGLQFENFAAGFAANSPAAAGGTVQLSGGGSRLLGRIDAGMRTARLPPMSAPSPLRDTDATPSQKGGMLDEKPIEELDLNASVFNSLKETGITTVGDVLDMLNRGPDAMLAIRDFGQGSLDEVVAKLKERGYTRDKPAAPTPNFTDIGERIKWLARTQLMNGSWQDSLEMTAAALLALVRAGHTTRAGNYRQQVKRAAAWLQGELSQPEGFPALAAARALKELERASGDSFLSGEIQQKLPAPATAVERAVLNIAPVDLPDVITTLDDLRMAALAVGNVTLPAGFKGDGNTGLVQAWLALGKPT